MTMEDIYVKFRGISKVDKDFVYNWTCASLVSFVFVYIGLVFVFGM